MFKSCFGFEVCGVGQQLQKKIDILCCFKYPIEVFWMLNTQLKFKLYGIIGEFCLKKGWFAICLVEGVAEQ